MLFANLWSLLSSLDYALKHEEDLPVEVVRSFAMHLDDMEVLLSDCVTMLHSFKSSDDSEDLPFA